MSNYKNVLIFGSSLCRDLSTLDECRVYKIRGVELEFRYRFFSGKSFDYFLENPHLLYDILSDNGNTAPDIVLTIFGGNSIATNTPNTQLYAEARNFFSLLRAELNLLNPSAIIVASEIPKRYIYNHYKKTPRPGYKGFKSNDLNHDLNRDLNQMIFLKKSCDLNQTYKN